jgi:cobalt/nickel transport protein
MNSTKPCSTGIILTCIVAIVLLAVLPLLFIRDSEFGGADGAASDLVTQIAPEYNAEWVTSIWSPPGGETESMLFALQAAVGGVLIGYCFGYLRGARPTALTSKPSRKKA